MKVVRLFCGILVLLTTVACLAPPEYTGELTIPGLQGPVEIIRDSYAVPHIYAETEVDACFALGYAQAQDRLFQMEMIRRFSLGRLSEVLGSAMLATDKLNRILFSGVDKQAALASLAPETRARIDAFVEGINYYIEHRDALSSFEFFFLGFEPEPWSPEDVVSISLYYSFMFSPSFYSDLLHAALIDQVGEEMASDIFLDYNEGYPTTIPEGEAFFPGSGTAAVSRAARSFAVSSVGAISRKLVARIDASDKILESFGVPVPGGQACNNLVISGALSKTGKPILAHDSHNPYMIPALWYEAHLSTPNADVSGYVIPASPYIYAGQNEKIAWVFTAGVADDLDFYIEKIDPANPLKYLYNGEWRDMEVREETIRVRGSDDVQMQIRRTLHGPIVNDILEDYQKGPLPPDSVLSMRWAAVDFLKGMAAFFYINEAQSADGFLAALEQSDYRCPSINWVYADDQGEIGYFFSAAIPVRNGFDGSLPVPGWTDAFEWQGYVPASELPQVRNPEMGFIHSSNSKPVPDEYPYVIGHDFSPPDRLTRVRRIINETVAQNGKFGVEDVDKIFRDTYVLAAEEWVPILLQALGSADLSPEEALAREKLAQWDFVSDKDAVAPAIFQVLLVRMVENTFSPRLGAELYGPFIESYPMVVKALRHLMAEENSPWFDDPGTPETEGRADMLAKSFKEAVAFLNSEMGPGVDGWVLGRLLTLKIQHFFSTQVPFLSPLLDVGPYPMSGGLITPMGIGYSLNDPYAITGGSTNRFVVDFADRRASKIIAMPGISGHFNSPHYADQFDMWYRFEFRPFMLYRDQVDQQARYVMSMLPQ